MSCEDAKMDLNLRMQRAAEIYVTGAIRVALREREEANGIKAADESSTFYLLDCAERQVYTVSADNVTWPME